MKKFNIALLTMILMVSSTLWSQKDIHFNPIEGKTYRLEENVNQTTKQTINGMEQEIKMVIKSVTAFQVISKKTDIIKLGITIEKMVLNMQMGANSITYNSDEPLKEGDMLGEIYSHFINSQFFALVDDKGKVDHLEGFDEIFNQIFEDLTLPPGVTKEQIKAQVAQSFSSNNFKNNIEMLTYIFPDRPIKVGDSWVNESQAKTIFTAFMKNEWQVKSLSNDNVEIQGKTTISTQEGEKTAINGIPGQFKMSGNQTSNLMVDPETGWIQTGKRESTMQGTISLDKSPQIPEGMEIPIKIEITSLLKAI